MNSAFSKVLITRAIVSLVAGVAVGGFVGALASFFIRPMTVAVSLGIMGVCGLVIFMVQLPTLGQEVATTEKRDQAQESALPAEAAVLRVTQRGSTRSTLYVSLVLNVTVPNGRVYRATANNWRVKHIDVPRVQPGQTIPVKIDPRQPEFVFPNCDWLISTQ